MILMDKLGRRVLLLGSFLGMVKKFLINSNELSYLVNDIILN